MEVVDEREPEEEFYVPPPPATAFQANSDGSRLIITRIVNENFKSYAGVQELGPFHKYFTAIIGPNGSGKSNVIDSMLFVFGYRASRLRSKKLSALLHDSQDYGKATSCTVTVHFASIIDVPGDLDKFELVPGSEFYVSRTAASDNSSYYTVNGKRAQFKEVGELLRKQGIDLDHNRFLILQGEVEQISLMKPKAENEHEVGMLEYLEDIIGSSRFKEPIEKLDVRIVEQGEVRKTKYDRCQIARNDLANLQAPFEDALRYIQLENTIVLLNHQLLQKKIAQGEVDKVEMETAVREADERIKELKKLLEEKRKELKTLENSNTDKAKELERVAALKESAKAEFDASKLKDVALQQEVERTNKKRKDVSKTLASEEEKRQKLQKVPQRNQETIAELEALEPKLTEERQAAEEKHAEIMASLQQDTQALQDEKESLQTKLAALQKDVDQSKSKHDVAKTELTLYTAKEETEKKKAEDIKKRHDENRSGLKEREKQFIAVKSDVSSLESGLVREEDELGKLKREEASIDEQRRKLQLTVEEARVSMQATRGRGKVLDALMQEKAGGRLPGVFGRMGDLGAIDSKYDVAISTACGALDNIVVDNVDTAEKCIQFLKRNNIGSATFVALDKQERFRQVYSAPFRSPENVPRLFDLIRVADDRLRPVFYFALQDTLVATNLDQASRISYGATRYRVVTLSGELIEIAGTMSGGGRQVLKGRMGQKVEQQTEACSPQQVDKMERKLEELVTRLGQVRSRVHSLEEQIGAHKMELGQKRQTVHKLNIEIESMKSQEPVLKKQVEVQALKAKESTVDPARLASLTKVVNDAKKSLDHATDAAGVIEAKVNKLHAEIIAKTKGRVDAAQKQLNDASDKLEKVRQEKTKLRVAVTTAARNLKKCEERIEQLKGEVDDCAARITKAAGEIKANEEKAKKTLEVFEELNKELRALEEDNTDFQSELDVLLKAETTLKSKEIDLKSELSKAKAALEGRIQKLAMDRKRMKTLKLAEEPMLTEQPVLKVLSDEELADVKQDELLAEIKRKEESLPKTRPNLGVIQEYQQRKQVFIEREKDLENATNTLKKYRELMEKMKQTRLVEFIKGFQVISQKVRECYQMLAEGGDAELELANRIDPFLDGVRFTVRPPKKSWKEIQYLSGGEKTLSSLSLIFALHYYKPTPLYFMDEIDSALDWKNTAIVAHYVKEQTRNAQFIIVSLRENMFEIADQLVGIYKTFNCTKSVAITPHMFVNQQ